MLNALNAFKSIVKFKQIQTDNNVFKLHYKVTVIALLVFAFLLTTKQLFGDPINCDVAERKEVIDAFCWIHGTFIIEKNLNDRNLPGLGLSTNPSDRTVQTYYQWVCIVFCAQALVFYFPRYLWKTWEGGRLSLLVKDLIDPVANSKWNEETKENLVKYMLHGKHIHNIYAIRYGFCEVLNFANVIAQIYFMDWFITGRFSMYGIAYATFQLYEQVNPMDAVFPKITKCKYYKYGPTGTQMNVDALCILPLNVLNEKFFLILWYWFFFLLIVSFLSLLYRAVFLFVSKYRVYLLRAQTRCLDEKKSNLIINHITYGDFFLLYKIGKNVNPILYKELVVAMFEHIVNNEPQYKNCPMDNYDEV